MVLDVFCDCAYLCGIGLECFKDQEANESEKNIDMLAYFRMLCLVV